nr:CCA tRNA nucleotidyltransferase [Acetobacter musti]
MSLFPALQKIWTILPDSRLVGGAVRDMLLGQDVMDFDFATPEPPDKVTERLEARGVRAIPTGVSHGTVTALIDSIGFEITTLRKDERTDGRHAQVAWTRNWREDAARRDFTINAMSCGSDGYIHDYFGGLNDLAVSRVRFVGEPRERIGEDALRILRFFRFQGRFGDPNPDRKTLSAITDCAPLIRNLSAERIWSELRRILTGPNAASMFRLMTQTGVLDQCIPELKGRSDSACNFLESLIVCAAPPDERLRFAALLQGAAVIPDDVARCVLRLHLSRLDANEVISLSGTPVPTPDTVTGEDDLARLLADTPVRTLTGRTWLAQAAARLHDQTEVPEEDWTILRHRLMTETTPVFPLAGRDLIASGMIAGPRIGEILAEVRRWWWQGGCHAGKEACLVFAKQRLVRPL